MNGFLLEMYSNFFNGLLTANYKEKLGCIRIGHNQTESPNISIKNKQKYKL